MMTIAVFILLGIGGQLGFRIPRSWFAASALVWEMAEILSIKLVYTHRVSCLCPLNTFLWLKISRKGFKSQALIYGSFRNGQTPCFRNRETLCFRNKETNWGMILLILRMTWSLFHLTGKPFMMSNLTSFPHLTTWIGIWPLAFCENYLLGFSHHIW